MKMKVLENKKDRMVVEIQGARHTITNLLRDSLWEDNTVELAAYEKKHPTLGEPKLIIQAKDPKKALSGAIKRAEAQTKEFIDEFDKAVK